MLDSDTEGSCRLPVSPALDPDITVSSGLRFGTRGGSYIEYIKKGLHKKMAGQNKFRVDFKTNRPEGLIFFMFSETDFIVLYIQNGILVYSFNCGSGPSHLATEMREDDDKWDSVEFSRVGKLGKLLLDSSEVKVEAQVKIEVRY